MTENKHRGGATQPDQLCWNCKRCTNPDNLTCSWAEKGIPVDGWTAAQGREYFSEKNLITGERKSIGRSYVISECPLFIKDKPFATYAEALDYIAKKLGVKSETVYGKSVKYIKRFEKQFGEKLPKWVKNHAKERELFPGSV